MSEFFFVVKTILFSALLLMLLQMKISGSTLEQHAEGWIYHSRMGAEMQSVARGAVKAGHEGFSWVREQTRDVSASIHEATAEKAAETSASETRRERSSRSSSRRSDLD
jgi:hypothetical protein